MGVIESALEKLRRGGAVPDAPVMRQPAAALESWSTTPPPGPEIVPTRVVTLDRTRLRAVGYLPEVGHELRFADYYREIKRPVIQRALAAGASANQRLIMVTSPLPAEGKTFTALNLALSIARERDLSVLLIDADFAKAQIGRVLGVHEEPGLLDAVADPSVDVESLIIGTNVKGLEILPGGRISGGAAEHLASVRMTEIASRLLARNARRLILFDSAPQLVSSEARALNQLPGQILLVARSGMTPRRALQDAIAQLDKKKLQGLVLNNANAKTHNHYYGYPEPVSRESGGDVV
jgi:protein-tyrosine kinase